MTTFNMKEWLMENKSGMYSKTINEMNPATLGLAQDEADAKMQDEDDSTMSEDIPNSMPFQGLQPNKEKYKIQTNKLGQIESATNDDGDTFVVGDEAVTADGETIQIKSLIGQQGKVKAIYYTMPGQVAHTYDIDGLSKTATMETVGYVMKTKDSEGNIM